ncbi:MAG: fumarate reductase/succinate dehydrogenase flavoprotein subunit [Candidatus Nephthysia bennettiae]|uniref:FAD-binding protein n=1 Tax=Candidatus Nephthysia bennettiae TaxID=3127016 RepID=A0A934NFH8_9BACT|nr:FAD-binding protein [Candidatus Dormibacteraeota bacterium]MBJ7613737.1 FAD-binding protein [Candidatus Dormibacteraeota bacterium]PZR91022.1 MAG: fumarate reductase/succinate dehydrogenase flavoprotein subunit [Candidatus Dormibacteraeota bacterium]
MAEPPLETVETDVLVIGAGGAGMRGAIAAAQSGSRVTVVCKSLLGKAHTVMAEGGMAAALANVAPLDSWEAHFADTMKGGKLINNWRMAEIHAKEAPARVLELERWGAVFDRTKEGYIHQRPFGAHTYPRLAHIGDRTGLELIRSLQDVLIHSAGVDVHMEVTVAGLLTSEGHVAGAVAYARSDGRLILYRARAILLASGGAGKIYRVTSNSWESTGDGTGLAYEAGAQLQDMEFVQFHPTGMVWPPGVRGILVTEGVRGEGGVLRNKDGDRFMEKYDPERMELSSRDIVARAINSEVTAGRGTPHGGAFLDITHRSPDFIRRKLPSMHEQFLKLANVDITTEQMEVAPTIHYYMGGVRVDARTGATNVGGLFAAGEVASGLHGANRLGGNSLSDLLVFGARAGEAAGEHALSRRGLPPVDRAEVDQVIDRLLAPLERPHGDSPYRLMSELQEISTKYAPIIREERGLREGLEKVLELGARVRECGTGGPSGRLFNPGWHTAQDLRAMVVNAEALFRSAIERKESRGAHARSDYPRLDPRWGQLNLVTEKTPDGMAVVAVENEPVPYELTEIISQSFKRYTPEEV